MANRRWGVGRGSLLCAAAAFATVVAGMPNVAGGATPTLSLDRSTGLLDGQRVAIHATGMTPNVPTVALECNNTPGQPTVQSPTDEVPVSCSFGFGILDQFGQNYNPVGPDGTVSATLIVHTGIIGPPTLGVDSAGHNTAADAALYPCPPTAAQQAAGASCDVRLISFASSQASAPISFGTPIMTAPKAAVSPSAGLSSAQKVAVSGSGFTSDSPYVVLECNFTAGEPRGYSSPDPVGCTSPILFSFPPIITLPGPISPPLLPVTDPSGALSTTFVVRQGNLGGTPESNAYPCPPSAANVAAGGLCALVVEDAAGERSQATIDITGPPPQPAVRVFPAGGLADGTRVGVTGWNFSSGSSGGVLECNDTPGQPTIVVVSVQAPVGCSNPLNGNLVSAGPDGTLGTTFVVHIGVVGPVASGTDSAGRPASVDAAAYPCPPTAAQQAAGAVCQIVVGDLAGDVGRQTIAFAAGGPGGPGDPVVGLANAAGSGYWTAGRDGGIYSHGGAPYLGSLPGLGIHPSAPIVDMAATPDGKGYWLAGADGSVFAFGTARYLGSLPGLHVRPGAPIVGMAATPDGKGYWLAGGDGGVFAFGDAPYVGSPAALLAKLHGPGGLVLTFTGIGAAPDGKGYWLVSPEALLLGFGSVGGLGGFPFPLPGGIPVPLPVPLPVVSGTATASRLFRPAAGAHA